MEIQAKTSSEHDAGEEIVHHQNDNQINLGMNGDLTVEVCDAHLNCCNAGAMDSDR